MRAPTQTHTHTHSHTERHTHTRATHIQTHTHPSPKTKSLAPTHTESHAGRTQPLRAEHAETRALAGFCFKRKKLDAKRFLGAAPARRDCRRLLGRVRSTTTSGVSHVAWRRVPKQQHSACPNILRANSFAHFLEACNLARARLNQSIHPLPRAGTFSFSESFGHILGAAESSRKNKDAA